MGRGFTLAMNLYVFVKKKHPSSGLILVLNLTKYGLGGGFGAY
jgi:hypothetical protein